jgi:hypothetical protein
VQVLFALLQGFLRRNRLTRFEAAILGYTTGSKVGRGGMESKVGAVGDVFFLLYIDLACDH